MTSISRPSSSSNGNGQYRRSASVERPDNDNGKHKVGSTNSKGSSRRSSSPPYSCFTGPSLAIWSLFGVLIAAFLSLQYYLPKAASSCLCPAEGQFGHSSAQAEEASAEAVPRRYNESSIGKPKLLSDGRIQYEIAVVSDLDQGSKMKEKPDTWRSYLRRGRLLYHPDHLSVQVQWLGSGQDALYGQLSAGGRAMELSDLCIYDGHLLTVDDRTGVVYKVDTFKDMIPWVLVNDGPGNTTKGLKAEWMTVKDKRLYVGGLGKEWTTVEGKFLNYNPMFVKIINQYGEVLHVDWTDRYKALRRKVGIEFPGYMIHESGQWSAVHKKWFFLPRRASNNTYSEVEDEHQGVNMLLIANEDFSDIEVRYIGSRGDGFRGFSAFQFLPGTDDDIIVALKSEEREGKAVASYLFIFRLSDMRVLMDDQKFDGPYKFEGLVVY